MQPSNTENSNKDLVQALISIAQAINPVYSNIKLNVQHNTTNSLAELRLECGWGAMTFSSSASFIGETVTFATAFTTPPMVMLSYGGDQASGTVALGNGGNLIHMQTAAKAVAVTATNFQAYVYHTSTGVYSTGNIVYYHWIALGR